MAQTVQKIRKVEHSAISDFDEQLWPINVAIVILAGFVAGIVIAYSSFDDPHILRNGWTRLAVVGMLVGLLFWGVFWLEGKMLRRLRLCIVLALLTAVLALSVDYVAGLAEDFLKPKGL